MLFILVCVFFLVEKGDVVCSAAVQDTISYQKLGKITNGKILIDKDVDLKGAASSLPKGITLVFKRGMIRNGSLVGKSTKIEGDGPIFDRVIIKGTWDVPRISTTMFVNPNECNSLKNVLALANSSVQNEVVIGKGTYSLMATEKTPSCIVIPSHTNLILNGTLLLSPNNLKHYNILSVEGENISISGSGAIVGDKYSHLGSEGEWGMGINFKKAANASVSGLTIKDCWGDCIYVGGNSRKITIEKCTLKNGRRQGVSITSANRVTIRYCSISDIGGTAPEYAIDVEPNKGNKVDNVLIDNVVVSNCEGGLLATLSKDKIEKNPATFIGRVTVKNCKVSSKNKYPILFRGCQSVSISGCDVATPDALPAIHCNCVDNVLVEGNTIRLNNSKKFYAVNGARKLAGRKDVHPISVLRAVKKTTKDNKIISL